MSEQEKAEKAIRETAKKYFENHMAGKDINTVLYEVSKKVIFELGSVLGQCQVLNLCLDVIKSDTELLEKLDYDTKQSLELTILGINEISDMLNDILVPIVKVLEEE